jgi:hypothetical protein
MNAQQAQKARGLKRKFRMKSNTIIPASLILAVFLSGCSRNDIDHHAHNAFMDSLTENQIGETNYYISIPNDYDIKEKEGPDFSVFYFTSKDTTKDASFSGGLYFGNFSQTFPPPNDSCKVETIKSKIFDNNANWTVFECSGDYSVQTIISNKHSEGWNNQIHAFGQAGNINGIYKLLEVYSTLNKR